MTYQSEVMKKAHELYGASDGAGRDLFAACLSVAHAIVKDRRARSQTVADIMATRRRFSLARFARATNQRMAA